jgi:hypothetical protein
MLDLLFVYSGDYGERVIRNLINDPSFYKACGLLCDFCKYGIYSYVQNICAAIELPDPADLPRLIEKPGTYLPGKVPPVDLCIASGIHQDLLLALPSCTATIAVDPEIGEPILHKAGFQIREAVENQLFS